MSARNLAAYLKAQRIPYVDVTEARRALIPAKRVDTDLKPFHFVVYGQAVNLLVLVGARNDAHRWHMAEWERLFGAGFRAVFARFRTHPVFVWDDGSPCDLLAVLAEAPKAGAPDRYDSPPGSEGVFGQSLAQVGLFGQVG